MTNVIPTALARITTTALVVISANYAHAVNTDSVRDIQCGSDSPKGDAIVCEYAIIASKYKMLFDAQFKSGAKADRQIEVRKKIAECDELECVEKVIDQQISAVNAEVTELVPQVKTALVATEEMATVPVEVRSTVVGIDKSERTAASTAWVLLFVIALFVFAIFRLFKWLRRKLRGKKQVELVEPHGLKKLGNVLLSGFVAELLREPNKTVQMENVTVKPWGRSCSDGYEWDGQYLKPWGRSLSDGYEWDGQNLKRWGCSSADGYEWDGQYLKPWGRSLSDGLEWDGQHLKPWGGSISDGYVLEGLLMKPWGKSISDGWEATGPLPVPVWSIAVGLIKIP